MIEDDYLIALQKIDRINKNNNHDQIIIFGSSMSREGIDDGYLKETLDNQQIYNLSISSGKPSDFFFLFERIKNKQKINLVVINLSQWMFQKKFSDDVENGKDLSTKRFFLPKIALKFINLDVSNIKWFMEYTISSTMVSLRYNDYIKKIIDHNNLSFWKIPEERDFPVISSQYRYSHNKPEKYFLDYLSDDEKK